MTAATCGARTRLGDPCKRPAGWGTDHNGFGRCSYHGGKTPNGRVNGARLAAEATVARFGVPVETDPHEALRHVVALISSHVATLMGSVEQLDDEEAIAGGDLHPQVRALHGLARDLAHVSKIAIDAGVQERRVQLEELVLERMAAVIGGVLDDLDLTPAQRNRAKASLAQHLPLLNDLGQRPAELVA